MKIHVVDAFSDRPFAGNPAAVCVNDQPLPQELMQSIAAEMNRSETAFLVPTGRARYNLRWFTPVSEVDLCGHATLAGAHHLWETGRENAEELWFDTRSGPLSARREAPWIELDFPAEPGEACDADPDLVAALGVEFSTVQRNRLDYLVLLDDARTLRGLTPDTVILRRLSARGVIATAPSDHPNYDFLSRYFAPAYGIDEDPVTGSAHCFLGPFWSRRLGKDELLGFQASARGGEVGVKVCGERVKLRGKAVTVLVGDLELPEA